MPGTKPAAALIDADTGSVYIWADACMWQLPLDTAGRIVWDGACEVDTDRLDSTQSAHVHAIAQTLSQVAVSLRAIQA